MLILKSAGSCGYHGMKVSKVSACKSENALMPAGNDIFRLVLKERGQAALKILLPDNADTIEMKAAELLKEALEVGTGCRYMVEFEKPVMAQVLSPVFSIGATRLYRASGIFPKSDLGEEGYVIGEAGGNLFLAGGKKRGAVSAVIALLEEDLCGRYYTEEDGLCIPEIPDIINISLREYVPEITLRTMFQSESFHRDYQLFNRIGASREKFEFVPGCWGGSTNFPEKYFIHTFQNLLSNEEYFDSHPEYFALIDGKRRKQGHGDILGGVGGGQLCLTNPEVRKIVTRKVLEELEIYHPYGLFDISENDVVENSFCQCDNCRRMKEKEGADSGALIDFINEIAQKVSEVYPDVRISTLAYVESAKPPKHIRPHKNVIIRLANRSGLYPYPIVYAQESGEFYSHFKDWVETGARLFIWEYAANYLSWLFPRPNLMVLDNDINLYAESNIYGLFLQSSHYGPGENQGRLRAWVYSKKMWDPSSKIGDLIRDFNSGYYGEAADYMQAYSNLLDREWHHFHKANEGKKNIFEFSDDFIDEAERIFRKAFDSVADNPDLFSKVEFEYVNVLFYRLQTVKPRDRRELQEYTADLSLFSRLTEKYHIESIAENKIQVADRIEEWKEELRKNLN